MLCGSNSVHALCVDELAKPFPDGAENKTLAKMDSLLRSPDHREFSKVLEFMKETYTRRQKFVEFFENSDQAQANQLIDEKTYKFLSDIENKLIPVEKAEYRVAAVFGETFGDLGYKALHLEDRDDTKNLWRLTFKTKKTKLAQTSDVAELDYWLPVIDRNTFLFFDADIFDQKLVGFRVADEAINKFNFNPRRVAMASSHNDIAESRGLSTVGKLPFEALKFMKENSSEEEPK